ncbi:ABC transporter ATP-binding protein [Clostridiaceae bacterium M8S5]|nr:ABC transporter ATP-binding protein [Clostridiaceae bacterium M8S5]
MNVLEIKNLKKFYGKNLAVNNVNLQIEEGQIYGILGPNGAGKSTMINMICGLLSPTDGEIYVLGEKMKKGQMDVKNQIGLVPQDIAIYDDLSAIENVSFFGSLYGLSGKILKEYTKEALEFVALSDKAKVRPSKFSGGMKRRLNIACSIVHKPKLIIMDEPTVGIDPQSRNHILSSIKRLNELGSSIIYTSHYMEEVQTICNKVAIIDKGKIIAEGSIKDVIAKHSDTNIINIDVFDKVDESVKKVLHTICGIVKVEILDKQIVLYSKPNKYNLDIIINELKDHNVTIKNIESKFNDLETIFLNLTGKKLRD